MALTNVRNSLSERGVIVLIDGENRQGEIKAEYREEMARYRTIERPYSRDEITQALNAAGLPAFAFFGSVNGWVTREAAAAIPSLIETTERGRNFAVAAKSEEVLRRIVPPRWHGLREFELLDGFSEGLAPNTFWSSPCSRFRVLTWAVALAVGGSAPKQEVRAYGPGLDMEVSVGGGEAELDLRDLAAGTEVFLCSSRVFIPAWEGTSRDSRALSFWVRFPPARSG